MDKQRRATFRTFGCMLREWFLTSREFFAEEDRKANSQEIPSVIAIPSRPVRPFGEGDSDGQEKGILRSTAAGRFIVIFGGLTFTVAWWKFPKFTLRWLYNSQPYNIIWRKFRVGEKAQQDALRYKSSTRRLYSFASFAEGRSATTKII